MSENFNSNNLQAKFLKTKFSDSEISEARISKNRVDRRNFISIFAGFSFLASSPLVASSLKKGIKVGYLPITDHLLMIASKIIESENFTIIPIKFASWGDIGDALRAGAIDAAFLLAPLGMVLKASGVDIKVAMAAHKNGSALIVKDEINSVKELENRRVAIPSRFSSHYFMLDTILDGVKVKLVDMAPPEMPSSLKIGTIDAYIVAEPFGLMGLNLKGSKVLAYTKDIKPNHICCTLNVATKLIKEPYFAKFLEIFKISANLINEDENLATKLGAEILGQDAGLISQILREKIASYDDLSLKMRDLAELKEFLVSKKLGGKILANLDLDEYML